MAFKLPVPNPVVYGMHRLVSQVSTLMQEQKKESRENTAGHKDVHKLGERMLLKT